MPPLLMSRPLSLYISTLLISSIYWAQPFSGGPRIPTVLMVLLGIGFLIKGKISFSDARLSRFITILALLFVPACLSLINSYDPKGTIKMMVVLPLFIPFSAAFLYLLEKKFDSKLFFYIVVLVSSFWMLDGVVQLIFGNDLFGVPPWTDANGGVRTVGPFAHHLRLGLFLSITLPLVLFFLNSKGLIWQLPYLVLALFIIMLTGVRTDLLTALIAIFLYFIANKKAKYLLLFIPIIALSGLAAGTSSSVSDSKLKSFLELPSTYQEWNKLSSYRLDIWLAAKNMVIDNPIVGVGVKSFSDAYDDYAMEGNHFSSETVFHAHHPVISVTAESGLVGLSGLLAILILLYKWGRTAFKNELFANPWFQMLILMFFPIQSMPLLFSLWWFPFIAMTMLFYLNDINRATIVTVSKA